MEAEEGALGIGARECLCEVCEPLEGEAFKPGADACSEFGEGVEVSVPGLGEEVV